MSDQLPKFTAQTPLQQEARRQFLKSSLGIASSLLLAGCGGGAAQSSGQNLPTPPSPQPLETPGTLVNNGESKEVIVIGAGAAGLVAAYELTRAGHRVSLLEARERVGGRIYTLSTPFFDQQFVEAGASRIPSNHNLTLAYATHFDLTLDAFYPTRGDFVNLTGQTASSIDNTEYLNQPPWPGSVNRRAYQKIRGGMDNLPKAFAQALADNTVFSAPVSRIEQHSDKVTVTILDGQQYVVDHVLCTVPLPVLDKIEFIPALSAEKNSAAKGGYDYAASSRLFTQFSSRFWQNQNLNGWGNTDLPEEIWQPTWDNHQPSGIIMSYLRLQPAVDFDLLSAAEQINSVQTRWQQAFGGLSDSILITHIHAWSQEQWSGAAFAAPTAAQNTALAGHIGSAEGRVHFAGEHASNFHGWIQGALESGIRGASEIHNSV